MNNLKEKLVTWLFETGALRVCPQDKPFWYTSGAIGPYYINTHFLYGSEDKANSLLKFIDNEKADTLGFPKKILEVVIKNYNEDKIFKELTDEMIGFINNNPELKDCEYISGGERRDWFFSIIAAHLLKKPHVTIYKDLKAVIIENGNVTSDVDLTGKKVLHIADLINEASSYERAWIPAIEGFGGKIIWSMAIVDRMQGGAELLKSKEVVPLSMIDIDIALFERALASGYINESQFEMISEYIKNPKEAMKNFLKNNPDFMQNALNSDDKTKERARMCIEKNIYS